MWCRRVICEWRWRRWHPTARTAGCGRPSSSTGSAAAARWPAIPIGNLMLAGLNEVLADPVAALDELGRILGVKGRVLPMCPIALADRGRRGRPGIGPADEPGDPRPGGDRHHRRARCGGCGCCRAIRRPPGRRSTRSWRADLVVLGPGLVVHQRDPARAGAASWRGPAGHARAGGRWCSIWWPSRGRRRASPSNVTSMCWPSTRRGSPCTTSSSTPPGAQRTGARAAAPHRDHPRGRRFSLLTWPDLVHLYMTRRGWPRRWRVCACAGSAHWTLQQPTAADARTGQLNGPRGDDPWR